jgi:hypothetical protein
MEGLLQLLVAGGDGAVLLEAVDRAFDDVAFAVGGPIEANAATGFGLEAGNDGADPPAAQVGSDRPARIPLVADDAVGAEAGSAPADPFDDAPFQQGRDVGRLVALARRQNEADRLAAALGPQVQLGAEAAAGAAEGSVAAPFLAPAALWCARIVVPSSKCRTQSNAPVASRWTCNAASARSQTPARCQRRQRLYTVCHGPYRSGRSRHGAPVANRHSIALTRVRWSLAGRPVVGRCGGSNGSSFAHWASVSSCRWLIHQGYHAFANRP